MANTSGARDCPRARHHIRTDRESVGDPISDRGSERDAVIDDRAVAVAAAVDHSEAIVNARPERGTIPNTGANIRTCRRGAAPHRNRIEDGELAGSDIVGIVVGRRADPSALRESERSTAAVNIARSIAVYDSGPIPFDHTSAVRFDDTCAISLYDA